MQYLRLDKILSDVEDYEAFEFERLTFNGGEKHIRLGDFPNYNVPHKDCLIETQLKNSDSIMELLIATDALRRKGVTNIYLFAPYIPYGRQDRVMVSGEALGIKVIANLINSQGYEKVYTLDPHSSVTPALINNLVEINRNSLISMVLNTKPFLISPDAGSEKKTFDAARQFHLPVVKCAKIRDLQNGEIIRTEVYSQGFREIPCLIVDDICDGGRTFVEIAKKLKEMNAGRIELYVSHAILPYALQPFKGLIDKVYTANCFRDDMDDHDRYGVEFEVLPISKGMLR